MTTAEIRHPLANGAFAFLAVAAAAVVGQIATTPNLEPWYAGLAKLSFNPPNWLFGPAWTVLYILMAFALWRVLQRPSSGARTLAVLFFAGQVVLNALWPVLFFQAHNPALGLVEIVIQVFAIILTIVQFAKIDRVAAGCLVPLFAWVSFATILNAAIWRLN